jgi:hypothetical protein
MLRFPTNNYFILKKKRLNIVHFWIIFLLILVLPIAREWRLLLNGERVEGEVVEMQKIASGEDALIRLTGFRALIEYRYMDRVYLVVGPENVNYEIGEKIPLIIHPEKENSFIIASIPGFYIHKRSVVLIIVLILWIAIYTTIVQMQGGQYTGSGSRKGNSAKRIWRNRQKYR